MSLIDRKHSMDTCNPTITHQVPNLLSCPDCPCCNNLMPSSDLKYLNIHTQLLSFDKVYAEPHIVIQVLCTIWPAPRVREYHRPGLGSEVSSDTSGLDESSSTLYMLAKTNLQIGLHYITSLIGMRAYSISNSSIRLYRTVVKITLPDYNSWEKQK